MLARFQHRDLLPLLAILLVACFVRVWGIGFGLPFTYHPDEHQYVDAALGFLGGDLNPHKFNNPALFKVVLGAVYGAWAVVGRWLGAWSSIAGFQSAAGVDPTAFYLLARLLSAVFGVGTVALTWQLGQRLGSRLVGAWASLAVAVAFLHVRDSHYAVNDVPAAFFTTAALLLCLRVLQRGSLRDYVLIGVCIGLATATKYTGALAGLSLLVAHWLRLPAAASQTPAAEPRWQMGVFPGAALARLRFASDRRLWAAIGAGLLAYLVAAPYTILDWSTFIGDVGVLSARGATGFKGLQLDDAPGWLFYLKVLSWGLGLPLLLASLGGLVLALWRRRPADLVLLAFPLALYLYLGSQLLIFARFIIPVVPVLAILSGELVEAAASRLTLQARQQQAFVAAATLALLAIPAGSSLRSDLLLAREDTRTLAKTWIEANIPAGTSLLVHSNGPELSGGGETAPASTRQFKQTVLGTTSLEEKPLDYYREKGYQYVVVSSFSSDRVLLDAERQAGRRAYYTRLDSEATRIQEFLPYSGETPPPFVFDQIYGPATDLWRFVRPGPRILVYRLP